MENLSSINDSVRHQLISLERISREIKALIPDSKPEYLLKEKLNEKFLTVVADLMAVSDFLFEASFCMNNADINLLLEVTKYEG
ncbi:MAG: hypothetical protein P4L45_00645 [Ignavibacteriaceae bacterium]|nr:hypothetical protein [Ignavibacteriaceae bacterium]